MRWPLNKSRNRERISRNLERDFHRLVYYTEYVLHDVLCIFFCVKLWHVTDTPPNTPSNTQCAPPQRRAQATSGALLPSPRPTSRIGPCAFSPAAKLMRLPGMASKAAACAGCGEGSLLASGAIWHLTLGNGDRRSRAATAHEIACCQSLSPMPCLQNSIITARKSFSQSNHLRIIDYQNRPNQNNSPKCEDKHFSASRC